MKNKIYGSLDKRQLELLFKEHFVHLVNFAMNYVPAVDDAKEIVQDVFINLWERRETIDTGKPVKSYLFTSVRNRCLNYIRDNKKFRSELLDIEIANYNATFDNDNIAEEELKERIKKAMDKLPEKCGEVFRLSRIEELKYKEIAEKLGISVKTVEAQMSKALKILREELKDFLTVVIFFLIKGL